jgi:signal transduction histidine kinase
MRKNLFGIVAPLVERYHSLGEKYVGNLLSLWVAFLLLGMVGAQVFVSHKVDSRNRYMHETILPFIDEISDIKGEILLATADLRALRALELTSGPGTFSVTLPIRDYTHLQASPLFATTPSIPELLRRLQLRNDQMARDLSHPPSNEDYVKSFPFRHAALTQLFRQFDLVEDDLWKEWAATQTTITFWRNRNQSANVGMGVLALLGIVGAYYNRKRMARATKELGGLYEEAVKANNAKDQFLAIVSHELRTPLTAIIGYAELIEMGINTHLEQGDKPHLARIQTAAWHLAALIDNILDFSRLEAEKETITARTFPLCEAVRDSVDLLSPNAIDAGVKFHHFYPSQPIYVHADEHKIKQVVINLVGNAIKFTRRGGDISVTVTRGREKVYIKVSDTGVGIEACDIPRIFEPFWQVNGNHLVRDSEGTGLGLAITRSLVDLMGGDIEVSSEVGVGSTFVVALPLKTFVSLAA